MGPHPGEVLGSSAEIYFFPAAKAPLTLPPALRGMRGGSYTPACLKEKGRFPFEQLREKLTDFN